MSNNKSKETFCTGALATASIVLTTAAAINPNPITVSSAGVAIISTVVTADSKKKD